MGSLAGRADVTGCLPVAEDVAWITVDDLSAAGAARRQVGKLANRLGYPAGRVAEIELATTEVVSNVYKHGGGGTLVLRSVRGASQGLVEILALDAGRGIADLRRAFEDGQSTAGGLGIGLGTVARLADSYDIASGPDRGTVVLARFLPVRGVDSAPQGIAAGLTRPIEGEDVCGDAYAIRRRPDAPDRLWLMLCDGSGHGPLAASAAQAAVGAFCRSGNTAPEQLIRQIHEELRGSRGAAVAVAELDLAAGTVRFAGLGNVAAFVVADGRKHGLVSLPGIAGYQAASVRAFDYQLPVGATLVLHSDGLTDRWEAGDLDQRPSANPLVSAASLLRVAGRRRDDAGVLLAATPARASR
ncbi:MAG TPA: ATP-binding SpoIIE family protein phosphatase [Pseudonocardiaceae bacterium]|nr:ATP-binding SpoIIE family protein phosphatase [Pseudonocardiaceae bacterium]